MRKISRRGFLKATGIAAAFSAVTGLLTACGDNSSSAAGSQAAGSSSAAAGTAAASDIVNIGSTGTLATLNPLMVDATWINMYAATLQFNPLVALDENAEFADVLADSIETEDNLTYTVHLNENAVWSDGQPITSADLKFTMNCLTSAKLGNTTMMLGSLAGTDDNGFRPDGVDDIEGVQIVDEKTCTFTFKYEVNKVSFLNGYAQYIYTVPEHILKDVAEEEMAAYEWFKAPTVVSGPYRCVDVDYNHYASFEANEAYWQGAPSIPKLNIRIVAGAQLLTGLQSGEIDVVPPLLGTINQDDYETVLALPNVDAEYGAAYAVEGLFINCKTIPEKEIRQALLCGLDRQTIIDGLLGGAGVVCDGFAVPDGPYYKGLEGVAFDAGKAAELVETAKANGWDSSKEYNVYLNSGEDTLIHAAEVAQGFWSAIGINVKLNPVDLDTLMTMCVNGEGDMYGVQYTYPPVDPSWDIQWVLDSWCFYWNDTIENGLNTLWSTNDSDEYAETLYAIDQDVQENVPIINLYANGPLGAVAKRISGARATMYGCLNNVHQWTINA